MPVPSREVVKRMGLEVQEVHITKTCSVFGQVYFSDCEIQYYDDDAREYKPLAVKRGTILVDVFLTTKNHRKSGKNITKNCRGTFQLIK